MTKKFYKLDEMSNYHPLYDINNPTPIAFIDDKSKKIATTFGSYNDFESHIITHDIDVNLYKLCDKATKVFDEPTYLDKQFFNKNKSSFSAFSIKGKSLDEQKRIISNRKSNMKFFRMYMMGDENIELVCPMFNIPLENIDMDGIPSDICLWTAHHILVKDKVSVHKQGSEPNKMLRFVKFDECSEHTTKKLKDFMKMILISDLAHKVIHTISDSDITIWKNNNMMPYALKSKKNWKEWIKYLESFGYNKKDFGKYKYWINTLKGLNHGK